MGYRLGTRSRNNVAQVRPDLVAVIERALDYGIIDFGVPARADRTQQEQNDLYAQGRTKPGEIVTWTTKSNHIIDPEHGYSNAVDCVPWYKGKYVWTERRCLLMATTMFRAAADLGVPDLEWGYHLWGKDMPHFQITKPLIFMV